MSNAIAPRRFWFGCLETRRPGGLILWDRTFTDAPMNEVRLYHYGRDELVYYEKSIVRAKLRPLDNEELKMIPSVVDAYFACLRRSTESRASNNDMDKPDDLFIKSLTRTCYDCGGSGFEFDGTFGSMMCRTCLGWGKVQ